MERAATCKQLVVPQVKLSRRISVVFFRSMAPSPFSSTTCATAATASLGHGMMNVAKIISVMTGTRQLSDFKGLGGCSSSSSGDPLAWLLLPVHADSCRHDSAWGSIHSIEAASQPSAPHNGQGSSSLPLPPVEILLDHCLLRGVKQRVSHKFPQSVSDCTACYGSRYERQGF